MPIDREDGRHWCDPASETPGEDGTWTCPGSECHKVWRQDWDRVWRLSTEEVPEQAPVEAPAEAKPATKRKTARKR